MTQETFFEVEAEIMSLVEIAATALNEDVDKKGSTTFIQTLEESKESLKLAREFSICSLLLLLFAMPVS